MGEHFLINRWKWVAYFWTPQKWSMMVGRWWVKASNGGKKTSFGIPTGDQWEIGRQAHPIYRSLQGGGLGADTDDKLTGSLCVDRTRKVEKNSTVRHGSSKRDSNFQVLTVLAFGWGPLPLIFSLLHLSRIPGIYLSIYLWMHYIALNCTAWNMK